MVLNYNLVHFIMAMYQKYFHDKETSNIYYVGETQLFQYELKRRLLSGNEGQAL